MNSNIWDSDSWTVTHLLESQGLIFGCSDYFDECKDLFSSNPSIFPVSFDQILASAPSDNPTDSPNNRNNDLKLSLHSNSKQQFSRGYVDSMHDTSHQFNLMRIASETLNVQIKVYMTFMGKLSSRKIGRKGVDKVYLFMNAKEQFTLLLKARCARREADDFFQQVISAHSFWSGYKLRHLHHDRNAA